MLVRMLKTNQYVLVQVTMMDVTTSDPNSLPPTHQQTKRCIVLYVSLIYHGRQKLEITNSIE